MARCVAAANRAGADTLGDSFAYAALAMFAYKTDADGIDIDPSCTRRITATGASRALPVLMLSYCVLKWTTWASFD